MTIDVTMLLLLLLLLLLLPTSQVEVQGDPDVEHGGSRPVGQVTRGLDRLGELLR